MKMIQMLVWNKRKQSEIGQGDANYVYVIIIIMGYPARLSSS